MFKRGQITVFIIVGIFVLAVGFFLFYLADQNSIKIAKDELYRNEVVDSVDMFIEACLERSVKEGMLLVFEQGGYYSYPVDFRYLEMNSESELLKVPYYFEDRKVQLPTLSFIEDEVAQASADHFISCINGFAEFKERGIVVEIVGDSPKVIDPTVLDSARFNIPFESSDFELDVAFVASQTRSKLYFPIVVIANGREYIRSDFEMNLHFDFNGKYDSIAGFLDLQQREPQSFLVGDLSDLAYDEGYGFGFRQGADDGSQVLVSFDFSEQLGSELISSMPMVYNFGMRYDWEEMQVDNLADLAAPLSLITKDVWNITQKGVQQYQVQASGSHLTFALDPLVQGITIHPKTGLMNIDSTRTGNFDSYIYIIVNDDSNNVVVGPMRVIVQTTANDGADNE